MNCRNTKRKRMITYMPKKKKLLLNWVSNHSFLPPICIPFNFTLYDTAKPKAEPVQGASEEPWLTMNI